MLAGILLQVELATLPGNATKNSDPSSFQTGMIVTHDELYTLQTAFDQALQEGAPMDFVLTQ
ncbi:MAG: hypothetical protein A3K41_10285 [Chloroflexi bacterium RIFOXYD12_FULL_57_15]|nr:MAG: hypothetical protein A3K41_10285 [Chloroflexi bacterium RIFOXYD12_FULL_57_15]